MAAPASALRARNATVMQVVGLGLAAPRAQAHAGIIRAGWQPGVHQHQPAPARLQRAVILPQARWRAQQNQMAAVPPIARPGLGSRDPQVAGLGEGALLTDACGPCPAAGPPVAGQAASAVQGAGRRTAAPAARHALDPGRCRTPAARRPHGAAPPHGPLGHPVAPRPRRHAAGTRAHP
jgi:hypothetical protein